MDIITQNTYEVLELVEAGLISAEEVDYLISEGSINPYLFESVLDGLIAESERLTENTAQDLNRLHYYLKRAQDSGNETAAENIKEKIKALTNEHNNSISDTVDDGMKSLHNLVNAAVEHGKNLANSAKSIVAEHPGIAGAIAGAASTAGAGYAAYKYLKNKKAKAGK